MKKQIPKKKMVMMDILANGATHPLKPVSYSLIIIIIPEAGK